MIRRPIHVRLDVLDGRQVVMEHDYDGRPWSWLTVIDQVMPEASVTQGMWRTRYRVRIHHEATRVLVIVTSCNTEAYSGWREVAA